MKSRRVPTRRILAAIATAAAVPLLVAACSGGGGGSSDGKVTSITEEDYYTSGVNVGLHNTLMKECGKEVGITIKRVPIPPTSIISKVLQQASAKTLPDVLVLDNPTLQQVAASGALNPLTDFGIKTSGYPEGILDAGTYKGEIYGLAPTVASIALFYNKDMLAAANIQPPKTWAELKAAAKALTKGSTHGLAFSAGTTTEGPWQFLPFMWSNGGSETDIDGAKTVQALQLWTDMVKDGSVSQGVVNWSQADANNQFIAGNAAMQVNGAWQIPVIADKAPDLKYGVVPIPVPQAGDKLVLPLGGTVITIPRTGDKAKEKVAAKVVTCMLSDKHEIALAKGQLSVPTRSSLVDQFASANPELKPFTVGSDGWRARTAKLGADWPKTETALYNAIQAALTGKSSPADALKNAGKSLK